MKYSIIIPIYNMEKYLKQAIDSVVNQKRNDVEVILVNDGSTDKSLEICISYEKKFPNIKVIDKPNGGVMDTWMRGVKESTGEYICFLDSDDWVEDGYFNILDMYTQKNYDMIAFDFYKRFADEKNIRSKVYSLDYGELSNIDLDYLKKNIFSDESKYSFYRWDKVVKASVIKTSMLNIQVKSTSFEDCIIGYLNLMNISSFCYINYPLYNYRMRKSSVSHNYNPKVFEENVLVKDELVRIAKNYAISDNQIRKIELFFLFQNVRWQLKSKRKIKGYRVSFGDINDTSSLKRKLILLMYKFRLQLIFNVFYGMKYKKNEKSLGLFYE